MDSLAEDIEIELEKLKERISIAERRIKLLSTLIEKRSYCSLYRSWTDLYKKQISERPAALGRISYTKKEFDKQLVLTEGKTLKKPFKISPNVAANTSQMLWFLNYREKEAYHKWDVDYISDIYSHYKTCMNVIAHLRDGSLRKTIKSAGYYSSYNGVARNHVLIDCEKNEVSLKTMQLAISIYTTVILKLDVSIDTIIPDILLKLYCGKGILLIGQHEDVVFSVISDLIFANCSMMEMNMLVKLFCKSNLMANTIEKIDLNTDENLRSHTFTEVNSSFLVLYPVFVWICNVNGLSEIAVSDDIESIIRLIYTVIK